MHWQKLTITTTQEAETAVEAILYDLGTAGIQKETALLKQTGLLYLSSYFNNAKEAQEKLKKAKQRVAALAQFGFDVQRLEVKLVKVDDQKWAHEWEKYYHAQRITRYLTVVPTWEEYQARQAGEVLLRLDPGDAFGTGTHPTTVLALAALENCLRGGETVIDVGTGSGVLSIAACRLGARQVFASDLDEQAVASAKRNLKANGVQSKVIVKQGNLLQGAPDAVDLIVANVLPEVQELLLPQVGLHLKENGKLIMSGIIVTKKDLLVEQADKQGLTLQQATSDGKWVSLVLQKSKGGD